MAKFVILAFLMFALNSTRAADSHCEIVGMNEIDWIVGYYFPKAINDTHSGEIGRFSTRNIAEFRGSEGKYLSAVFINNEIIISITSNFTQFEEESHTKQVDIKLNFKCRNNRTASIAMYQTVHDVNNHRPIFNKTVYEYNFGMTIPEDFELTQFSPINATDGDFSNENIYFTADFNEDFRLKYNGRRTNDVYVTTLSALKNIEAPYKREFTLNATDDGNPPTYSSALLIITVSDSKCNTDYTGMANGRNMNIFLTIFSVLYAFVKLAESI